MKKRMVFVAVLAFVGGLGLAAMAASEGSWTGHISDSMCAAKKIDAACAKKCVEEHGAKYVFVNDGDNKIFNLDPQDKVKDLIVADRKSTRLNSSHLVISYAVFCLKKKKRT